MPPSSQPPPPSIPSTSTTSSQTKSITATVFVRFDPPSTDVHRRHLEELFSDIGPIKKCSVIQGKTPYGFVKFLTDDDARQAAKVWNHKSFQVHDKTFTLHVEVASNQGTINKKQSRQPPQVQPLSSSLTPTLLNDDDTTALLAQRKRTCRVMVRNLSFSAKERDIRTTLERTFGPILELQLPWVNASTHRGFCFVTFANPKDALQSTTTKNILIAKRPVAIDYALPKKMHQQQQQQQKEQQQQQKQNQKKIGRASCRERV